MVTKRTPVVDDDMYDDILSTLVDNMSPVLFPAGTVIFREGEPAAGSYLIERGEIEVCVRFAGKERTTAILGPGDILGVLAPIDDEPRSATARVTEDAEVIPIEQAKLKQIIADADPFMQFLTRLLLSRLRETHRTILSRDVLPAPVVRPQTDLDATFTSIRTRAIEQIKLEKTLREAITRHEFELYFQPIVGLKNSRVIGFEALIRWMSPERGLVLPTEFIPIAEQTGLIVPIGQWVLEQACYTLKRVQELFEKLHPGQPALSMSVNVSARQLKSTADVEKLAGVIADTGVDPSHLKIEITEGLLLDNPDVALEGMNRLRSMGVRFSVDDFGTGFSGLSYLHRFPIDELKIDRSFVHAMIDDREKMAIVKTISTLADELGLDVVAEGIEQPEEMAVLRKLGCDYGQGYLFSKPVAVSGMSALLNQIERHTGTFVAITYAD